MRMTAVLLGLVGMLCLAFGQGRMADFAAHEAVMDSLSRIPPRLRYLWLQDRGLEGMYQRPGNMPEAETLICVGRWSYGPVFDVDVRATPNDTIIVLARGSGASLLRLRRSGGLRLDVLADINCNYLVSQVQVRDSLLFLLADGLETYNISDPLRPVHRSNIATDLLGFDVKDTLVYTVGHDSFKVYSVADPADPRLLGASQDIGTSVSVAGNTAFLANRHGLDAIDVSNPASPYRVGTWGGNILSVAARGNTCLVTQYDLNQPEWLRLTLLDIADPAAMRILSRLDSCGGYEIHLDDSLAFLSGYYTGGHEFRILSISNSASPVVLGSCATIGQNFGVWGSSAGRFAIVADDLGGTYIINTGNLNQPVVDTVALRVGISRDLSLDGGTAYVSSGGAGLVVLDVTEPTRPYWIGGIDTANTERVTQHSVVARDSFAFVDWGRPNLRSVDVTEPTNPRMAGGYDLPNRPKSMVLRDSLLYVAIDGEFHIFNVARPREPRVVGEVRLPEYSYGMHLQNTLAYVSTYPLSVINVSDPTLPIIIGSIPLGTWNAFVKDNLAYLAAVGLHVWNVRDPTSPHPVDSLTFGRMVYDVVVVDTLAYLSCSDGLRLANIADPHNMQVLAYHPLPWTGGRLHWNDPHIYVAVRDAGISIFETVPTGMADGWPDHPPATGPLVTPNPAGRWLNIKVQESAVVAIAVYDAAGREVLYSRGKARYSGRSATLDLGGMSPGVYFLRLDLPDRRETYKFVKK
ncbi:MAG: T9SS type A sorting domain-containing protein [bacterium]